MNNSRISLKEPIKRYALPLWKELLLLIALALFATILTTMMPLFISVLLEIVISSDTLGENLPNSDKPFLSFFDLNTVGEKLKVMFLGNTELIGDNKLQATIDIMKLFLVFAFLGALFNYAAQTCSIWLKTSSTRLIRKDISRHILSLDLSFFHSRKSGELISRFTQDATNTAIGLGPLLHGFIHHGTLILIYSVYLFSTDYFLAIGVLIIIGLQWSVTKIIKNPVRKSERKNFDKIANIISTIQETFTNIRVIKSFGADDFELRRINKDIDVSMRAERNAGIIKAIEPHLRTFLDNFAIAGIFIIGVIQLQREELTIQGFLLFMFIGRLLITPINKFSVNFIWMQSLLASYDRLYVILNTKSKVEDGNLEINSLQENIIFNDVSFSYDDLNVVENLSFNIKKGEILAIVGASGAGKSTLSDLVLRLYNPNKGSISIDGVDLKLLNGNYYRSMFGVVPQESLLFNDTISNNICFGRKFLDHKKIEESAKVANAHEFIISLPNGYETIVGDRGVKLSGGQRQRISIARAIFSSPEIVIFDEATSSLDSDSEKKVQTAVENILSNSTAIIIAHRLSTIMHADKIIVMNKGKIEAIGKHKDLLATSDTYKRLCYLQFDEKNYS
jgi:subfamily B ATP-binding cassette protein MsbA